jgi:hypothetical protein
MESPKKTQIIAYISVFSLIAIIAIYFLPKEEAVLLFNILRDLITTITL